MSLVSCSWVCSSSERPIAFAIPEREPHMQGKESPATAETRRSSATSSTSPVSMLHMSRQTHEPMADSVQNHDIVQS
ncbi:hypothetical protein BDZ85DRAFT_128380 [Elsinoe ampelina]|uniref:Uncharacterized protein n=1 Tax=Elsinoe ampelina TaxID=302913 RepID=A0A6A6GA41_9PEZI|nr:hypothetical protein BDZ85DRAFT_128380 [Elsinoe ampelina]